MPELWENCTVEGKANLGYLNMLENGFYPDWDERSDKYLLRSKPNIINVSEDAEDEALEDTRRFMRQAPESSKKVS